MILPLLSSNELLKAISIYLLVQEKLALSGFVWGLLAFVCAARAGVESSVIYYGTRLDQHLELVQDITCPLLFHFAGDDEHISTQTVKK